MQHPAVRIALGIFACALLGVVYVFQRVDLAGTIVPLLEKHPFWTFAINKIIRLTLNDLACLILILAIFQESAYLRIAFYVFLVELLLLMPLYLALKLSLEGPSELSSPLLSQIHRLIVNPTLMVLLIAGFVYQRSQERKR